MATARTSAQIEREVTTARTRWQDEQHRLKRNGMTAHDARKKVARQALAELPTLSSLKNCQLFIALVNQLRLSELVDSKEANRLIYGAQTFIVAAKVPPRTGRQIKIA